MTLRILAASLVLCLIFLNIVCLLKLQEINKQVTSQGACIEYLTLYSEKNIDQIKTDVESAQENTKYIKLEISDISNKINDMENKIKNIESDIAKINSIDNTVDDIKRDFGGIKNTVDEIQSSIKVIVKHRDLPGF